MPAKKDSRGMLSNGRKAGTGTFLRAPHDLFVHPDYLALSKPARAFLWDFGSQYQYRKNNGNLSAAPSIMAAYGYSKPTIHRLVRELLLYDWIRVTRTPMHPRQCYLYALSWIDLDDWGGDPILDVGARSMRKKALR
ncbi:MAG: hypothetical protein AAGC91_01165 [Pseudomonadota bacterium]